MVLHVCVSVCVPCRWQRANSVNTFHLSFGRQGKARTHTHTMQRTEHTNTLYMHGKPMLCYFIALYCTAYRSGTQTNMNANEVIANRYCTSALTMRAEANHKHVSVCVSVCVCVCVCVTTRNHAAMLCVCVCVSRLFLVVILPHTGPCSYWATT